MYLLHEAESFLRS